MKGDEVTLLVFFLAVGWMLSIVTVAANWFWAIQTLAGVCK